MEYWQKIEAILSKVQAEIIEYPKLPLSVDLQNEIQAFYELRPTKRAADGATGWACECGFVSSISYSECRWCGTPRR